MVTYLAVDDLVEVATIVLAAPPQVRDEGLLASAVVRPATVAFGQEVYPDLWDKAATLLHSICMNHALVDGNKRLAWAAARVFLGLNGCPVRDVDTDRAEELVMAVASGVTGEVAVIAGGLRALYA